MVVGRPRDDSYDVMLDDGKRIVHANNMWPYDTRVSHTDIIFQDEKDFGKVECALLVEEAVYHGLHDTSTQRLATRNEREVREMFYCYPGLFYETPGTAVGGSMLSLSAKGLYPNDPTRIGFPSC